MSSEMQPAPMLDRAPGSMFQTWIDAVTKPNERTYAALANSPNAKTSTAFLWVFIGSLIESVAVFLIQGTLMRQMLEQRGMGDQLPMGGATGGIVGLICGAPIAAVIAVVVFAIVTAIIQWIAKMFGGTGSFDKLAYAFAAIAAPVSIAQGVMFLLSAIPFVGFCFRIIGGLLGLYVLVLEILAVKGVNGFGMGAAIGSVLIPVVVVVLLACCLGAAIAALLGASLGNVFSGVGPFPIPTP